VSPLIAWKISSTDVAALSALVRWRSGGIG
jgi:hypothetical protein